MKKILITWANWMLATDFVKCCNNDYAILAYGKNLLDITNIKEVEKVLLETKPWILINFAAYTNVDDAEDVWMKQNYDVNSLWVFTLSKLTNKYKIDFITISTDYVFDWENSTWYNEKDLCNPINQYWMSKYLWEKITLNENLNSIIIRTSWLYWWWYEFKNFVNTMISLSKIKNELKVVNDQLWLPTYTKDLCFAIKDVLENLRSYRWQILHFSNSWKKWISWYEFAREIFDFTWVNVNLLPCDTFSFPTKAVRPKFSLLTNNSNVKLRNRQEWLIDYLNNLKKWNHL